MFRVAKKQKGRKKMSEKNKEKEEKTEIAAEAGKAAEAAAPKLNCNKTEYVYLHNKWEEFDSETIEKCKQINPSDWWLAYDNMMPHKYEIAIQCIARQEEVYFKEWIEHHLNIGIEHIYIYDNNDEDGLEDFLKGKLSEEDFSKIEVIPWHEPMEFQQHQALNHCVTKVKNEVKWLLSIDLDELFFLEKPMKEFLDEFSYASQVYFSWESIGADGQLHYEDKPVKERFKQRFNCTDSWQGKIMFRPERLKQWQVHAAKIAKGKTVNVLHNEIIVPDSFANIYEIAWVKHYFTKSLEEWTWKMERGCADHLYFRKYALFFEINPDLREYYDPNALQIQAHGNAPLKKIRKVG